MAAKTKPPVEARKKATSLKETKQRTPFKKKRGGVVLTREQVKEIREGREELRQEMRDNGIYSRKEFERTAASLGLYFDRNKLLALLLWLLSGRGLWALIGAAALLMLALFLFSLISQMQGHFTINLTGGMFREGFTLSESKGFESPTTRLFAQPAEEVPCISVVDIAEDVPLIDGQYEDQHYFAYTFYIRNEGQSTVDYVWDLSINSESQELSKATWFMVFEDDKMQIFAEADEKGKAQALPAFEDETRGYRERPLLEYAKDADKLYQVVRTTSAGTYYRLVPEKFQSATRVTGGEVTGVKPMEVHKYTVVIWLEGDDPDCTDDKIGGHLGVDMNFRLSSEPEKESGKGFWDNLQYREP